LLDWVNAGFFERVDLLASAGDRRINDRTDATAFLDRNDLDEGIRLARDDSQVGYTLAFRVPDDATSGPHEIKVRVHRPGIYLRYRESYQLAD